MATLAVLRTAVSSKIGLDPTGGSADQLLIDTWCNEAVRDVLLRLKAYVVSTTFTPVTSDSQFPTTGTLMITDVIGPDLYPVEPISPADILFMRQSAYSGPTRYYALNGSLFMLYPSPGSTDAFTIYHIPRPTEMSSGTHDPSVTTYGGIAVEYHKLLEHYACWQAADFDDDSSSDQGERYRVLYEDGIKRARRTLNLRGGRRLGSVIGGNRRRPLVPPRNDIDL